MNDFLFIIVFSAVSVVFLYIVSKISGKKEIAQINFIDFVFAISIGSIAANMATDLDKPFHHYIIAMTVFFVFSFVVGLLERKGVFLKNLLKGSPIMLIYEGEIDYESLKKSKFDLNDLIMLARNQGYFDLSDIRYAVLETNGQLSIMPKSSQKPVTVGEMGLEAQPISLVNYLVVDGNISYSGLNQANKSVEWLYKELGIESKKELKNIFLATFDEQTDSVKATRKTQN